MVRLKGQELGLRGLEGAAVGNWCFATPVRQTAAILLLSPGSGLWNSAGRPGGRWGLWTRPPGPCLVG
eukprot:CAMPEP_0118980360 /NCGR_PEP_ID=MMETSP1173-20130426/28127_1 /TAXON_ID=1034831 /ORGANISM="Rhizochromulina marina cf, Strain CCMP1243" /LENGTH=67 /DNA_ID=CAMNT_0006930697 /DNA_START=74 /DNA_END=274 /DNA_ORIENTATION=-